ncbi:MAG: hypothetical protein ACRDHF_03425 [Tepidiformaceae bacterium]
MSTRTGAKTLRTPRGRADETPLSAEESGLFFDAEARRLMNMSGDEFLQRWDAGEFDIDGPDHGKLISLEFLIPFARR